MTNPSFHKTLTACVVTAFTLILVLYSLLSSNPLSSRLGFAALSSGVPGLLVLVVRPHRVLVSYLVLFIALQVLIAML